MKRNLMVIGIGAGNPEYVTVQAVKALNKVSVFFIPNKGQDKADLHHLRREICDRYIDGSDYRLVDFEIPERAKDGVYATDVAAWRAEVRAIYERLIVEELGEGEIGGFLIWGDPSLYDGTMGILDAITAAGQVELEYEVIPGISSVSALAARHKVALNRIGKSFTVMSGRQLSQGMPDDGGNVVVMLDSRDAFRDLDGDLEIYWGGYVGTEDELLVSGKLRDVAEDVARTRKDARARKGWLMDTYLLSRPSDDAE